LVCVLLLQFAAKSSSCWRSGEAGAERAVRCRGLGWNHSVAEHSQSVHPIGQPISHSTNRGLKGRPNFEHTHPGRQVTRAWRKLVRMSAVALSLGSPRALRVRQPRLESPALGVGHSFASVSNPSPDFADNPARLWFPLTDGVGQNEESVSVVRGANG